MFAGRQLLEQCVLRRTFDFHRYHAGLCSAVERLALQLNHCFVAVQLLLYV